jgi:putative endopeptidase
MVRSIFEVGPPLVEAWRTLMRCTLRLLPRNAAAYALFTLATLAAYSQQASTPETHGIVVANMDRSVKPGDDFFRYANGDWIKRTEIPTESGYVPVEGWSNGSTDLTREQIAALIEEAVNANAPAGSNTRKIADFYRSFMDEATIEAKGLAPLRPRLDAIASIRNKHDLARALGEPLRSDVDP